MINIEYFAAKLKREREARSSTPAPDCATRQPQRQCSARPDQQAGSSSEELPPAA